MDINIENIIDAVIAEHKDFVREVHDRLVGASFKCAFEYKATGYFACYANPKTKRAAFNFYFRKNGLHVRLYPDRNSGLVTLTDYMVAEIDKQPDCKRLAATGGCNPKCQMGYDFELRGKHYQKCKCSAFSFLVTAESKPVITQWVNAEIIN